MSLIACGTARLRKTGSFARGSYLDGTMSAQRPFPVMDLSAGGRLVCLAAAGRSHVGDYAPDARPKPTFSAQHLAWAAARGRTCLYCPANEPTGGEEHVLGVALGNWFWVIPPNVVCGRCNNEVLSVLDTKLQAHPLIAMIRTLAGVTGRKGQPALAGASNMCLRRDEAGALRIEASHKRHVARGEETITMTPKWDNFGPPQRRVTARALLKLALGTIWLARGPDETSKSSYEHIRDAIRGDGDVPLQYGFGNSQLPGHALQIMTVAHEATPGLWVGFDYFGIELWARTEGYGDQASAAFLKKEIGVEFDQPDGA